MQGPALGPGGEDITWPDQVAPRGRKASSTRKIKHQTSNLKPCSPMPPVTSANQMAAYQVCTHQASVSLVDHVLHGICPDILSFWSQQRALAF